MDCSKWCPTLGSSMASPWLFQLWKMMHEGKMEHLLPLHQTCKLLCLGTVSGLTGLLMEMWFPAARPHCPAAHQLAGKGNLSPPQKRDAQPTCSDVSLLM